MSRKRQRHEQPNLVQRLAGIRLVSTGQASKRLGVSKKQIRRQIERGTLPAWRIRGKWVIALSKQGNTQDRLAPEHERQPSPVPDGSVDTVTRLVAEVWAARAEIVELDRQLHETRAQLHRERAIADQFADLLQRNVHRAVGEAIERHRQITEPLPALSPNGRASSPVSADQEASTSTRDTISGSHRL